MFKNRPVSSSSTNFFQQPKHPLATILPSMFHKNEEEQFQEEMQKYKRKSNSENLKEINLECDEVLSYQPSTTAEDDLICNQELDIYKQNEIRNRKSEKNMNKNEKMKKLFQQKSESKVQRGDLILKRLQKMLQGYQEREQRYLRNEREMKTEINRLNNEVKRLKNENKPNHYF